MAHAEDSVERPENKVESEELGEKGVQEDAVSSSQDESVSMSRQQTRTSHSLADDGAAALDKVTSTVEAYPTGLKLVSVLLSIYLSVFLVALDRTIIATALPKITDEFNSFGDIGWVSTALNRGIPVVAWSWFFCACTQAQ